MTFRRFFVGESANESILKIASNVNRQLIASASIRYKNSYKFYSPWMSVPTKYHHWINPPLWEPSSEFFISNDLVQLKNFFKTLNFESETLPSMEGYQIRLANLSTHEEENFSQKILSAKLQLIDRVPHLTPLVSKLILGYAPIEGLDPRQNGDFGMSVMWLKGIIFFEKEQKIPLNLRMENIAHELAHQILIHYQLTDPLIASEINAPIYSAIRNTKRPAIMAFHGAAALSYMLMVARANGDLDRIELNASKLLYTLNALKTTEFTKIGKLIFREMYELL